MSDREFQLEIHAKAGRQFVPHLRRHLTRAHQLLRRAPDELSLALVGDKRMAELHEKYLGIAGPTDVLTFELEHGRGKRVTAGEVVVCVPQARRQTPKAPTPALPSSSLNLRAEGRSTGRGGKKVNPGAGAVADEVLLLALHGLLHLCGYNDLSRRQAAAMHRAEDRILTRLGIGKVYARGPVR